jgi:hypothetical protein
MHPLPAPTVSQRTWKRLYAEAQQHPAFEGMEPGAIREYIDERLAVYLGKQPYWYGHIDDTRHHAAQRQYKARRGKERSATAAPKTIHEQEGDSEIEHICEFEPGKAETAVQLVEELTAA